MTVFLATLAVFALATLAMGVGLWLGQGKRPLRGSCGGQGDCACRAAGAHPGTLCEGEPIEVKGRS